MWNDGVLVAVVVGLVGLHHAGDGVREAVAEMHASVAEANALKK